MCLDKCLDNELEIRYALRQNGLVARTETASPDFLRIARHVGRRQGHNSERRAREAEDTAANHIDALIDRIRTPSRGTRSRWPEALQQRDHSLFVPHLPCCFLIHGTHPARWPPTFGPSKVKRTEIYHRERGLDVAESTESGIRSLGCEEDHLV